ncbi:hypothetical protein D9756_002370 [Leucocoprinus leucothites]|uniref:Uncharacterized protein n=1 Tax=Leucocoprinus leucothites TaxID=201217 RepID=A0A8H5LMJ0_9AGAR|nr:hypothetical protein D9756_002370 [Leucoagaricus leucothites]
MSNPETSQSAISSGYYAPRPERQRLKETGSISETRRRQTDPSRSTPSHFITFGRNIHGAYDDLEACDAFEINYPWFWETVPSKQEVRMYSNLPLDLVRSMFELAMLEHRPPSHFLLVSREVKSWVEPLLYRHVYFSNSKQVNLFYRTYRECWVQGRKSKAPTPIDSVPSPKDTHSIVICPCRDLPTPMLHEMINLQSLEYWTSWRCILDILQVPPWAKRDEDLDSFPSKICAALLSTRKTFSARITTILSTPPSVIQSLEISHISTFISIKMEIGGAFNTSKSSHTFPSTWCTSPAQIHLLK